MDLRWSSRPRKNGCITWCCTNSLRDGTSHRKQLVIIFNRTSLSETSIRKITRDCFFPGGRAPEYLRYDPDLLNITAYFIDNNKPVASVCHGIEILAAANCIQGRKVTTVAKCELDATTVGAVYVDEPCVVDGNLVSARVWQDNTLFLKAFLKVLKASAL